jgi:hypothetical protein
MKSSHDMLDDPSLSKEDGHKDIPKEVLQTITLHFACIDRPKVLF